MSHKGYDRTNASGAYRSFERRGRTAIPRNDGRAGLLESVILLSTKIALAIALGLSVGLPLMLMLSDFCGKLTC